MIIVSCPMNYIVNGPKISSNINIQSLLSNKWMKIYVVAF